MSHKAKTPQAVHNDPEHENKLHGCNWGSYVNLYYLIEVKLKELGFPDGDFHGLTLRC